MSLFNACYNGKIKKVILKIWIGVDVNKVYQVYKGGWTPLMIASKNNYLKIIKYLVSNGADVNKNGNGGFTPLWVASAEGNIKEDPLRVYRGYRFFSKLRQYGFEFEKETLKAMRGNFEFAHKNTAPERVRVEIEKIIGV